MRADLQAMGNVFGLSVNLFLHLMSEGYFRLVLEIVCQLIFLCQRSVLVRSSEMHAVSPQECALSLLEPLNWLEV